MENLKNLHQGKSQEDQNLFEIFTKYKRLLWEKKYWILIFSFCFSAIWVVIYSLFLNKQLEYTSSATLKFDDPRLRTVSAITDIAEFSSDGKVAILYTNSFLLQVVDSLRLNLVLYTPGINRFKLFNKIHIDENAKFGDYKIVTNEEVVNIFFTNKRENVENINIYNGNLPSNSEFSLEINGIKLTFDAGILRSNKKIDFGLNPRLAGTSNLLKKMTTSLNRSQTILTLSFTYDHPESSAIITNTIAELFIKNLLEHKRFRTSSILSSLEDQLRTANQSLDQSEEVLRRFRERNPYLLLSNAGSNIVEELSDAESELTLINFRIDKLEGLIQQKNGSDKNLAYLELISFWEEENASTDHIITEQYAGYLDDQTNLIGQNYSTDHPRILEIDEKLSNLQKEIDNRVSVYLNQLKVRQSGLLRQVNKSQRNLRRLPSGELDLAELQQDRAVKAEIYSTILIRYNEAQIADASIIADAFIIDKAEVPINEANMLIVIFALLMGPVFGFAIAIILIIFLDYIDDSIKRREEIESKLQLPVLSEVPVIFDEYEIPKDINLKGQLDYKLITSDYSPSLAGERFRLLRTKLLNNNSTKKTFIITSLAPGDGKSLVASNLAITFAQQKVPTVLIDADLRRGVLHNSFNINKKPGLSDLLVNKKSIDTNEISSVLFKSHVPYLSLITSGLQIPNPSELLGSPQMVKTLEYLESEFDVILFDTPPVEFVPDGLVLNSLVHNILFVVRYGKTRMSKVREKIFELSHQKSDFCGFIINASQEVSESDRYSYSYYHY